jgi:hypothetical protein
MELEIKTAEELVDPALEARWVVRRESRMTDVYQAILRTFRDRGGPVSVRAITVARPGLALSVVREKLGALDAEDLIQLRGDRLRSRTRSRRFPRPSRSSSPAGPSAMRAARSTRSALPPCWGSWSRSSPIATTAGRPWRSGWDPTG